MSIYNKKPKNIKNITKLNSYYFKNLNFEYDWGKFKGDLKNYDLLLYNHYVRIIDMKNKLLKFISVKNKDVKIEKIKKLSFIKDKDIDYLIYENSPLLFYSIFKELNMKFNFASVKSYYFIKYKDKIKKKYFSNIIKKDKFLLIFALKDWEEISDFKYKLNKSYNSQFLYSSKFYLDKEGDIFVFFKGDMIIISKNIDPIFILKNMNKIPLTSPKENKRNYGYIITDNYRNFKEQFELFNYLEFNGKVEYYFYDLDNN